jgi:DMSO/TMAO reductase YedYZ molybdopterin-dependent catalytic subunit
MASFLSGRLGFFAPLAALLLIAQHSALLAQTANIGPAQVEFRGAVTTPLVLSQADFKTAPRATLHLVNPNSKKAEVYEGVPLTALLQHAGVPQCAQLQGAWMAAYVQVEAADGYRVVFSLAELDSGFLDSEVLVADTVDGMPLGSGQGPFKLVAPHDKRPARWVRMLKSVTVVRPPNP